MTGLAARSQVLLEPHDAIPEGARFIEARFRTPEDGWAPAIPGALLATLDNGVLARAPHPDAGRFPLPDRAALVETLDGQGVHTGTPLVVYAAEPEDAKTAARAWFVLRDAGFVDVRVLDGGAQAWKRRSPSARPVEAATPSAAVPIGVATIDATEAASIGRTGTLLDARPDAAFAQGHIPGATSAPGHDVFEDGRLLPHDRLTQWAASLDLTPGEPVGAYCGGGVAAAGTVLALAALGIEASLYVGSWSHWSRQQLPVEVRPVEQLPVEA